MPADDRRFWHPSGRPIRRREQRALTIRRFPRDGYLTPRLNYPQSNISAVGFLAGEIYDVPERWRRPNDRI